MAVFSGPEIVNDGLVLHLDAANSRSYPGSGNTWTDLSGLSNNGTLVNGPLYSSVFNGYISFDGVNDYITTTPTPPGTSDFTISVWVYLTDNTSNHYIFDFGSNGGTLATGTDVNGYGFRYYNPTLGIGSNVYTQGTVPNIERWYNVVISRNSGTTSMHIDGVLDTSSTGDTYNITSNTLYIGKYGGGTGYEYEGYMSDIKLYNRALSDREIKQNYYAIRDRYANPPVKITHEINSLITSGSYPRSFTHTLPVGKIIMSVRTVTDTEPLEITASIDGTPMTEIIFDLRPSNDQPHYFFEYDNTSAGSKTIEFISSRTLESIANVYSAQNVKNVIGSLTLPQTSSAAGGLIFVSSSSNAPAGIPTATNALTVDYNQDIRSGEIHYSAHFNGSTTISTNSTVEDTNVTFGTIILS